MSTSDCGAGGLEVGTRLHAFIREVVAVPEIAVERAGKFGGAGTEGGTAASKEKDGNHIAHGSGGVGDEPAEAGALIGAGSGFAEDRKLLEIRAETAGGAVLYGSGHAV